MSNRRLDDTITYWASPSPDGWGDISYGSPVQINGRWEHSRKLITDSQGQQIMSVARVAVDQDVDEGGWLYKGTSAAADPKSVDGAYRIVAFESARSLVRTRTVRIATLGAA